MIDDPDRYAEDFVKAGADLITFHIEAPCIKDPKQTIAKIRSLGAKVGVSVKPKTPASAVLELVPLVDMVLVMTVEPGFGGQKFMVDMMVSRRLQHLQLPKPAQMCSLPALPYSAPPTGRPQSEK